MKKIFFGMLAIVAMVATSCQQDVDLGVKAGETAIVSLNVGTPTRAYSDGTTATTLQYAVYDAAGNYLSDLAGSKEIYGSTTIELKLVTGNQYDIICWADNDAAPYTVDLAAKTISIDYSNVACNDETLDAFYKKQRIAVKGAQSETIELKRPFAQINIGTADYEASRKAGYIPTQSAVTVKGVYSTLNLWDGTVADEVDVNFATSNIKKDEVFPVPGNEYMAMNYVLVNEKEIVDVIFTYTDGADAKTRTVGSVPVQRNHRTNIYGELITSDVTINVEIAPEYMDPAHEADALYLAAAVGGEVTLTEDVVLTTPLHVQTNMTINLNGKTITGDFSDKDNESVVYNEGHTLTISGTGTIKNVATNGAPVITNNGKLTLSGVTIQGAPVGSEGYPSYAVYNTAESVLVVEEGTTIVSDRGAIHMKNADVTINGGNFIVTDALGSRTLTAHVIYASSSNSKLTINDGNFALNYVAPKNAGASVICPAGATIKVYGGNFYYAGEQGGQSGIFQNYMGYGAPVDVYGGTFNDNTVTKSGNLAEGYVASVNADGTYTVTTGVKLNNIADLEAALANAAAGSTVILPSNITEVITLGEVKDVIIEAVSTSAVRFVTTVDSKIENVTIKNIEFEFVTGAGQKGGACVVIDKDAQIENLVLENCEFVGDSNKNSYGIYGQNPNASIVVKNCSFSNLGYCVQATAGGGYAALTVENCVFEGILSWAILPQYGYTGDLTITGCTFNNTVGGLVKTGAFSGTFTLTNNTITNSVGHDGADSKWFDVTAATKVVSGNTMDGAAWEPTAAQGLK